MLFNKLLLIMCMTVLSLHGAHLGNPNFSSMITCSSGSDQKIERSKELKKELNVEFMQKAKINDLVSYIYYPYYGDTGHAELEVEGVCSTYKLGKCKTESFDSRMVRKRACRSTLPFYRYVISVTPEQLKNLCERMDQKRWCTPICSLDALTVLAKGANYSVPFIFRLSPLISAHYLSIVNSLGSERIKKIKFYEGHSAHEKQRLEKIIRECIHRECLLIVLAVGAIGWGLVEGILLCYEI
jgi:hypothetical protein